MEMINLITAKATIIPNIKVSIDVLPVIIRRVLLDRSVTMVLGTSIV
jgi:hypothetical protein